MGHHVSLVKTAGITAPVIRRITQGPEATRWTDAERHLLRAADQLNREPRISDATWAALTSHYDEDELIEITMFVGRYHMVAFSSTPHWCS